MIDVKNKNNQGQGSNPLQNLKAFKMYLEIIFKCHLNHIQNAFKANI